MRLRATITSDHGVVFIADPVTRSPAPPVNGRDLVVADQSCVAVCTMHPQEGETTFELSVSISRPLSHLVFEGELETPGRKIAITGSDNVPFLSMDVCEAVTSVKIWTNDLRCPNYVQVLAEADFSDVAPYAAPGRGEGVDRTTAERLAQAARKLDLAQAEFNQISAGINDSDQKNRINLSVLTAVHDIQESIFAEIGSEFPDLLEKKSTP
jgi:hypothetical protein